MHLRAVKSEEGKRCATASARRLWQSEGREWWLWGFAVTVTLSLTAAIVFLTFFENHPSGDSQTGFDLREWTRGLVGLVLLFNIYTLYQHLQLHRIRKQLAQRNELFELITENAADMIAVIDGDDRRIYNSPAYLKVLGYSSEELNNGSAADQIHPSDRDRVYQAAAKARATGRGQRLEYRMRHKDGTWRILESTASPIPNAMGEKRLVVVNRDITERKRAEDMLEHSALFDSLTDLPNRALFSDRLQHALMRARRHSDYKLAVLFIDIDEFKIVNDSLGHSAGDELLIQVTKRLTKSFRETDTLARAGNDLQPGKDEVARLGGDEFTVLLEDVLKPSDAIRVAQRIQERISTPFEIQGTRIVISTSIGVVCGAAAYDRSEELLRDAEIAMYRAKQNGKARCELFDPAMHAHALRRLTLESDLRRALDSSELMVHYQPIVSLATGKIVGFEALSRWQTAQKMIMPAEFIPIAEETGLIVPINRAVLLEACRQVRNWQSEFRCDPPLTISVNIAPRQFADPELPKQIAEILQHAELPPTAVTLEIMETAAMGDADRAMLLLSQLKCIGVRLSLDDFGTGYSSLSRLPRFPIDVLKIDRVFIANMQTDRDSYEIVTLILKLAQSLRLKVVAEGTETEAQVSELTQLGCEMAQGFFYSPAVNAENAFDLLLQSYEPAKQSMSRE